jgi:purine-binding chemotaxis protein CheW
MNQKSEPKTTKEILKLRAKALAGGQDRASQQGKTTEVVEFLMAYERHAFEVEYVREVHPLKELAVLPGLPEFVLGIINVRGRIVSVVDLKKFFGLPTRGLPDLNRVIVIADGENEFGVLADAVTGVKRIAESGIQPPPPTLSGVRAKYLRGITEDRLAVLNAVKILADPGINLSAAENAAAKKTQEE